MSSDTGGPSDGDGEASKASSDLAKMEALLEQLRNKHNSLRSSQSDSWNEFAKQIRMASLVSILLEYIFPIFASCHGLYSTL